MNLNRLIMLKNDLKLLKYILMFLILISFILKNNYAYPLNHWQKKKITFFENVIDTLSEVMPREKAVKIILDPRVRFEKNLILLNIVQPAQDHYFRYILQNKAVNKGLQFLDRYYKTFKWVEEKYGVEKEIILAILYVETNFNPMKAKYNVFNAYASLAFADHPQYIKMNEHRLRIKHKNMTDEEFEDEKKALLRFSKLKSEWALKQLKALYSVSKKMKRPMLDIMGSFAGAIGYPQFIPTSYLSYAVDGNNDDFIDLYNIHDSIASIGNYLKTEGYNKNDLYLEMKSIFHYNHNWDYVRVVIEYAQIIKSRAKY